ncbi:hypothetical protein D3C81_1944210 [compost metagenome]
MPGLVVAADGDLAFAGGEVFQVDADRVQAFDACDVQLGDCRGLDVYGFIHAAPPSMAGCGRLIWSIQDVELRGVALLLAVREALR